MKNAFRKFCLFNFLSLGILAFTSSCSNSNAFEIYGTIYGIVTDYTNGQPLNNATVVLSPGGVTKLTDAGGYYQFENLEIQQYTLTVQHPGYQPNRKTVSTVTGEEIQVDIQLSPIPQ